MGESRSLVLKVNTQVLVTGLSWPVWETERNRGEFLEKPLEITLRIAGNLSETVPNVQGRSAFITPVCS